MDFAATLEYMLDMYEHTKDIFIIDMHVCMYVQYVRKKGEFNCTLEYYYYHKQLKTIS